MKKTRGLLLAVAVAAMAFIFSCSSGDDNSGRGGDPSSSSGGGGGGSSSSGGGGNTVSWKGKDYRTAVIGSQTWFAENLNYAVEGSKCYGNDLANCETYGRLYDWETAKTACPSGWHLPSDAEWNVLMTAVGGSETAGTKLKATSGWNENGNGTDEYGFSALPGGYGNSDGSFSAAVGVGDGGNWWSATESSASYAYYRDMRHYSNKVDRDSYSKSGLFSVRCAQD